MNGTEIIQKCKEMMEKNEVRFRMSPQGFRFLLTEEGEKKYPEVDPEYEYCPICVVSLEKFKEENRPFSLDGEPEIFNSNFEILGDLLGFEEAERREFIEAADGSTKSRFYPLFYETFLPREN